MTELPKSWATANILKLSKIYRGVTYSRADSQKDPGNGLIAILRATNITEHGFIFDDLVFVPREIVKDDQVIRNGDIVVATSSGSIRVVGKAVQAREDIDASFGAFCALLRPFSGVEPRYFGHFFGTNYYRSTASSLALGININNLKAADFEQIEVPIAPLNEQKRIADKLDTLLARVDASRAHLERVQEILKDFRQSVLAAAVSGRLTEEWREEKDIKNWDYEKAMDICEMVQSGGTPREGFVFDQGIPFLKVYNLVNQKVDFCYRPQYVRPEIHNGVLKKSQTIPGDVLMNIVGPPLGKVAIVPNDYPEWNINQAITLFRPSKNVISRWLYYFLCSGFSVAEIIHETRGSAGQSNISLTQCRNFVIPVPTLEEQQEIVSRVDRLFSFADQLEARVQTALDRAENLTPSLLAKAFRGELVEQDPNDEPASVLLERIRAEREAGKKKAGQSRKPVQRGKRSKTEDTMKKLADIKSTHLSDILKEQGRLTAEALWKASELAIDDFYDQLKIEEAKGLLREKREDESRLLEAI